MARRLSIASIQANPTVGAIEPNEGLARRLIAEARQKGADLAVFSELFLIGYPPEDLALKPSALDACRSALERLAAETAGGGAVLMTLPWGGESRAPRNAVALLCEGEIRQVSFKSELPNYGVFDEKRIFEEGEAPVPFRLGETIFGAPICEDIWAPDVAASLRGQGAEILLVPNGSPFRRSAAEERLAVASARTAETGLPIVYVNQVGGQDELVFDGGSFALGADGALAMSLPLFAEAIGISVWEKAGQGPWRCIEAPRADWPVAPESAYRAMVLGLGDYVRKSGFAHVLLGLSGGVDSALAMVAAVDALGAEAVRAYMLPSRYTSKESLADAAEAARRCGVRLAEIPIEPAVEAFTSMLAGEFAGRNADITEENLQARIRGVALMALSNKLGAMLLTTGNKSEMAVGYATLYGDMCGGYNPLKDLYKVEVFEICRWRNAHRLLGGPASPIPEAILSKPPSAELRANQRDDDSLPPYGELDAILMALVEDDASLGAIVEAGHDRQSVAQAQRLLYGSEYKRRQAPPGVKLGRKSFGRDRRYPIVNGFRERLE
ncbi:MAG: NAD+ synthase [Caulobacteraceae bacterium]